VQSAAEIPFVAGHVALDFVNTAEERGHPDAGDVLRTADDLRLWGQRRGVLAGGTSAAVGAGAVGAGAVVADGDAEGAELAAALEARELLYKLFLDLVHGRRASDADRSRLSRLASTAYQAASLDQEADGRLGWSWDPARLATVRHVAVTAAVELLSQSPTARLRQCPGDHCGWFFLDTTKRGNRRWCSMGECGQQAKTLRRRERSSRTDTSGSSKTAACGGASGVTRSRS
jgi:predicted RNA-binding Zn ribbon-like protein